MLKKDYEDDERQSFTPRWLLLIFLVIINVPVIYGYVIWKLFPFEERGLFGDMFGGVNALFSGLAFGGVIIALFLQKRELELQRKELRLTRMEMEKSAEAQQLSVENIKRIAEALEKQKKAVDVQLSLLKDIVNRIPR
jgi:hypothetical protein